jgi:hypothetical protein
MALMGQTWAHSVQAVQLSRICNQVDLRQKIGLESRFGFIMLLGRAKAPKFTHCPLPEVDPTTCTGDTSVGA